MNYIFLQPSFFFPSKFTTWHIDRHYIVLLVQQQTEYRSKAYRIITQRGDDSSSSKTMASVGRQFVLLLWKNWLLQKRKLGVTVFEIVMPIVFAVILVCIRLAAKNETISQSTIWPPFKPNDVILNGSKTEILYSPNTTEIRIMMNTFRNFLPNGTRLCIKEDFFFHHSYFFLGLFFWNFVWNIFLKLFCSSQRRPVGW